MKKRDNERAFYFYRAQFASELPLLQVEIPNYAGFMNAVLQVAARARTQMRTRHWSVGNLELIPTNGATLLYGRIGKHQHRSGERYEDASLAFNPSESQEDHSVAFVFESAHEFLAIESTAYVNADIARENLIKIFNQVPSTQRDHFRLSLPPVEDYESAIMKLKGLKAIYRFSADLKRPNPNTEDAWEEFYENIHTGSGADHERVIWESEEGKLNPDTSTPIGKALQMAAAAYGTWKAKGRNELGKMIPLSSGNNIVTFKVDVSTVKRTIEGATHYFAILFNRTAHKSTVEQSRAIYNDPQLRPKDEDE